MEEFPRIVSSPDVLGGRPRIKGVRIAVESVIGQLAAGYSIDQVVDDFPELVREDVLEALRYAAYLASQHDRGLAAA